MPDPQMMMQGQAKGSGMPATRHGYMSGNNMGRTGGGCPIGMTGEGMGQGYGMGPGMMGGMGGQDAGMMMGSGYGMGMMSGGMDRMATLDLSDEQINQLKKIRTDAMKNQRMLMRQMWDEQEKMIDLYGAERRDPAAIGKAYSKIADLQRQAIEMRIDTENKATDVLTKEQAAKMHRGFGSGMKGN